MHESSNTKNLLLYIHTSLRLSLKREESGSCVLYKCLTNIQESKEKER